jgi:eukaryotic-like serine/threonine-protein kinase
MDSSTVLAASLLREFQSAEPPPDPSRLAPLLIHLLRRALNSGEATPLFSLQLAGGRTGLVSIMTLFLSADRRRFAYSDNEKLSRLYLVDGLARAHPAR